MDLEIVSLVESLTNLTVLKYDNVVLEKCGKRREYGAILHLDNEMIMIAYQTRRVSTCFYTLKVQDILDAITLEGESEKSQRVQLIHDKEWDAIIPVPFASYLKEYKKADN